MSGATVFAINAAEPFAGARLVMPWPTMPVSVSTSTKAIGRLTVRSIPGARIGTGGLSA
jgi:hypothetical protein